MKKSIVDNIKNGKITASGFNPVIQNSPSGTSSVYSKYTDESIAYYNRFAPYASNVFDAEIQGIDYNDFYKWTKVRIRSSNVINPSTGENLSTSWQSILILDKHVDFVPIGAYVKYNNSTWIVYNPDNIASPTGNTIVIRCNTTYNTLDYYGNIVKTPMFFAKGTVLASSPYYMEYSATLDGYQHIIMQLNNVTEKVTNNTRIILGKSAFAMYGVSDFPEEFTGDPNACHILRADLRLQETIEADDLENKVADGKGFSFTLNVSGKSNLIYGENQKLSVTARRNGYIVESSEQYPIDYIWESSNTIVATVDDDGTVHASNFPFPQGTRRCTIRCKLKQNPHIYSDFEIGVFNSTASVEFTTPVPDELKTFETIEIKAAYFVRVTEKADIVTFTLSNANEDSYSYSTDGNTLTLTTYKPSEKPLIITASYGSNSTSASIRILGY